MDGVIAFFRGVSPERLESELQVHAGRTSTFKPFGPFYLPERLRMKDDFELVFWTWFATDEHRLVRDACHGMKALDFLHLPSSVQSKQVNCCPECDIEGLMSEVEDFRRCVESSFPTLESQLTEVLNECHQLSALALKWNEVEMFTDPAWEPVRTAASKALQIAGWHNLRSHVEEKLRKSARSAADKGVADRK